jgi:predicted metalloprotease with PDZ domain
VKARGELLCGANPGLTGFAAPDANLADGFAATYHLPKTVPGTYATLDYGRFVTDFTAIDAEGKALKVKKKGNNSWEVRGSAAPVTVRYTVASIMELKVKKWLTTLALIMAEDCFYKKMLAITCTTVKSGSIPLLQMLWS